MPFHVQGVSRWECRCGCGLRLPRISGTLDDSTGVHPAEVFLAHLDGQPTLQAVVQTSLPAMSGVFGFHVGARPSGETWWRPCFAEELPPHALAGVAQDPAEWDGELKAVPMLMARLDPVFDGAPMCRWHLYGAEEPDLDFTFEVPDSLVRVKREHREADRNFARLGGQRFLRALLTLPVVGGTFRLGCWFEVAPPDFDEVARRWEAADYLGLKVAGRSASRATVLGQQLENAAAVLAPRTPNECLFVASIELPLLEAAWRQPLTPDELRSVKEELGKSVVEAALDRIRQRRPLA